MNRHEIEEYLGNLAQRRQMTLDWEQWYRNLHKGRAHKHGSSPYCEICDKKIKFGEEFYIFYVGGRTVRNLVPYHVRCVDENSESSEIANIVLKDKDVRFGNA
jgi:hypothetical protein